MSQDLFDAGVLEPTPMLTLATYAERAYLDYAISVVKGRALPEVADGQKPVQRRILYAMQQMGLHAEAKPVKSARVVGDVLGKFHPHGDQSAYDALVRLAQDFSLRYPLIDGQGNFGSRDGDGAAAMRYTEARLTPIASLLLDEIEQGTVDFIPNYDGSSSEPKLLPARLPFVLLNGASGIAVGMATEIPSHNLREVAAAVIALIRQPALALADLLSQLPAPDFPGGGQIISSKSEIEQIYTNGRGSLKVRARWTIEALARGQWQCVVTELPPNVSAQHVLEEIEEATNPKIKLGKKSLTSEQTHTKQIILSLLDTVRDESGKEAAVRLVFEPKSKHIDQQEFVMMLLSHTSLESNVSVNLVMVGNDGRPQQKGLLAILQEWVAFRQIILTRRCQHRLSKVEDRTHILEGRVAVLLNIDQVIHIIRNSDEPKPALMTAFALSDRQAEDILEIRLRQLARLEKLKIEQELAALQEERAGLTRLLSSDSAMKNRMVKEIEADAKRFGDARRTFVQEEQKAAIEVKIVDDPVTVIVSQNGWVRVRPGHELDVAQLNFKSGDALGAVFACRTVDPLIMLGSDGRAYSVAVSMLPSGRGDGVPLVSLVDVQPGTRIVYHYAGTMAQKMIVATSAGYGFLTQVRELTGRNRAGKSFLTIGEGETVLPLLPVVQEGTHLACLSQSRRLLVFSLDEVKQQSGGRGVILMDVSDEQLFQISVVTSAGLAMQAQSRAGKVIQTRLSGAELMAYVGKRARKGKLLDAKWRLAQLLSVDVSVS
ncbi:MAG: DNA topoisomerase IV subunit A [Ottowia sp.]|nr:DNA topoisomerase IV subunit A [Ottowia sp.]